MTAKRIAVIPSPASTSALYGRFLVALSQSGFSGEIVSDRSQRLVASTDNSIYQQSPQAVVYPRDAVDVQCLASLLAQAEWRKVTTAPRGGGTGTNGQSLTDGIVVDLSRHMNRVLEIDPVRKQVRVEAGVVKDQLNRELKPHGLFFAPELSTSNRATIGGMISTDASGQGSCTYGKTRDHVVSLHTILVGGERLESRSVGAQELTELRAMPGRLGEVYRVADDVQREHYEKIAECFPKLNRCLTGYDLAHLRQADGFNINSVLCGAEGTLGFLVEATLNVLPIPRFSVLVNVRYASFMDALKDARTLLGHKPLSIETVDSKVLTLAMKDIVWDSVAVYFPTAEDGEPTLGINLVEFSGDDEGEVQKRVRDFCQHLQTNAVVKRLGHTMAVGHYAVEQVYKMRKRAVGLLGNVDGEARPQPFVEDTAVPPEHLADYIAEFREVLDRYKLSYGMFGHVDAGVLHVRPALDMKDPAQAALVRPISDQVSKLTRKYGGLLWGEHGKGFRSEYSPAYFGELYPALQRIKSAFDPNNQLNPGKIATPLGSAHELLTIDGVAFRGDMDRQIDERVWQSFGTAMHCNGNGACYNFDPDDAMCPSWKATRDRVHSPKGRATLLREWLRLQSAAGVNVLATADRSFLTSLPLRWWNSRRKTSKQSDFSHEVYEAMAGCLACKSCSGQCPVKVNVPEFRSRFLQLYHQRYLRPLRDYLIGSLEFTAPWLARVPRIYNALISAKVVKRVFERYIGMVDSPTLSSADFEAGVRRFAVIRATPGMLESLSIAERERAVIIVQDAFTRYFETPLASAFIELASRLGYQVYLAPFRPNGKPLQVLGFLTAFDRVANRNARELEALAAFGIPLVGLEPATTLVYRQEYKKLNSIPNAPNVLLPQEWLALASNTKVEQGFGGLTYRLLTHCTEKTNVPTGTAQWIKVFRDLGLVLEDQAVGCCGMSGTYGHETRNQDTSIKIFDMSWRRVLERPHTENEVEFLATGYSCRSQVARMFGRTLRHPIEVLLEQLRSADEAHVASKRIRK